MTRGMVGQAGENIGEPGLRVEREARRFLMSAEGIREDEAIALISAAVDFGVTQVVGGNWGVHAVLSKRLFPHPPL